MAQLINEAKRFKKLAGLINESQLNEEVKSVDQALDNSKVQAAGEKLAQDPALLQKGIDQLSKLGIDKNTLMKAAQAHSSGKDVGNIIDDKIETATEKVNELESPGNLLAGLGAVLGGLSLAGGGLPLLAGAVILALAGAGTATVNSMGAFKKQQSQKESIESTVNEALAKFRKRK